MGPDWGRRPVMGVEGKEAGARLKSLFTLCYRLFLGGDGEPWHNFKHSCDMIRFQKIYLVSMNLCWERMEAGRTVKRKLYWSRQEAVKTLIEQGAHHCIGLIGMSKIQGLVMGPCLFHLGLLTLAAEEELRVNLHQSSFRKRCCLL